jgi:hypothetical protein
MEQEFSKWGNAETSEEGERLCMTDFFWSVGLMGSAFKGLGISEYMCGIPT